MSPSDSNLLRSEHIIHHNCKKRIKPMMLRDIKTEALLVFARTTLERFFTYIEQNSLQPEVKTSSDTLYVYNTLKSLKNILQEHVVNADYLINLVQGAKQYPELKMLAKQEESLMYYYDAMAYKAGVYFANKPSYIPEFLVVCILSHWVLEEEKSTLLYPFLNDYDFTLLIDMFESNREAYQDKNECIISEIHEVSLLLIKKLQERKYKVNRKRVSKTRSKKLSK